jgi:S-adenosylmethionine:tRNA ribosyltransferase-isomerase
MTIAMASTNNITVAVPPPAPAVREANGVATERTDPAARDEPRAGAAAGVVLPEPLPLGFELDAAHEAHEPPEAPGGRSTNGRRDGVSLMRSVGVDAPTHHPFAELPDLLEPGDLVVVNTSATVPAALDATLPDGHALVVHASTELPGGLWMIEPRRRLPGGSTAPLELPPVTTTITLAGGRTLQLLRRAPGSRRLWIAALDEAPAPDRPSTDGPGHDQPGLLPLLQAHGRPIRYPYVTQDWPIEAYQSVFGVVPGSAEMPSASRPFTADTVAGLVRRGVGVVPITLHTGVSSLEGHELPYPERYLVPASTAASVNAARATGGRIVAIGTTVVRALESAADAQGTVHPADGWTERVITPATGVRVVQGLLTGWHEPAATHLAMLEAVAGRDALLLAYREAFAAGYRWHEFGDSHLLLPAVARR